MVDGQMQGGPAVAEMLDRGDLADLGTVELDLGDCVGAVIKIAGPVTRAVS